MKRFGLADEGCSAPETMVPTTEPAFAVRKEISIMAEPENETGQSNPATGQPSDENKNSETPSLAINVQYIKDFSFEAPGTPGIFGKLQQQQPNITVKVDVQARTINAPAYEVVLHIRADCQIEQETVFVAELTYAGIFTVKVPENTLRPVLLIECPRMLFPFARQILANATMTGGFMPLMLGPVDFAQLYRQQMEREQAQSAQAAPAAELDDSAKLNV